MFFPHITLSSYRGYLTKASSLRNLSSSLSKVLSKKYERLMGRYNFAKTGSLPGFGIRCTVTFLHSIGVWPVANEPLNISIRYLIMMSSAFYVSQTGCTIGSQLGFESGLLVWRAGSLPIKRSKSAPAK